MKSADAEGIAGWRYEAPYDFCNLGGTEESVKELLNGSYWVVEAMDGQVVGFYCLGESAQVPAGYRSGAHQDVDWDVVDIGIGLRPDLTGKGLGYPFLRHVLRDVAEQHPLANMQLTVALFNERAIKLYHRFGFERLTEFGHDGVAFQTMGRKAGWISAGTP